MEGGRGWGGIMRLAITHEIHACMWNGCVAPLVRSGHALQPALIIGPMKIKGEKNIACSPLVLLGRRISDSLPTETTCQPITMAMITLLTRLGENYTVGAGSPGGAQTDVT